MAVNVNIIVEFLRANRGNLKMDHETMASELLASIGMHAVETGSAMHTERPIPQGETAVIVARDLRAVRVSNMLTDTFTEQQLHEIWAEFLDAQTL